MRGRNEPHAGRARAGAGTSADLHHQQQLWHESRVAKWTLEADRAHVGWPPRATPGALELYDVVRDPYERTNLVATHRALAESLRDEMHAFVARLLDGRPDPQLTYAKHPSATNVPY